MKKLLVMLHCKNSFVGDPIYRNTEEIAKLLAKKYNAEILAFNSILPYKEAYTWFEKVDGEIVSDSFVKSFDYAKSKISHYVEENGIKPENIIIFGRSQGGFMAICLGIELGVGKVVAMAADIKAELVNAAKTEGCPEIIWIEAGKDKYISAERRGSYKDLQKLGIAVDYRVSEDAEHSYFDLSIVDSI